MHEVITKSPKSCRRCDRLAVCNLIGRSLTVALTDKAMAPIVCSLVGLFTWCWCGLETPLVSYEEISSNFWQNGVRFRKLWRAQKHMQLLRNFWGPKCVTQWI
jgi:hypothetical protein